MVLSRMTTTTSHLTNPSTFTTEEDPVLVIQKVNLFDTEEISLKIEFSGFEIDERSYQLGTANFEEVTSSSVILGIIQNCDEKLKEFHIVRLGPRSGQSTREIFQLDSTTVFYSSVI